MSSSLVLPLILLGLLIAIFFSLGQAGIGYQQIPQVLQEEFGVRIPWPKVQIPRAAPEQPAVSDPFTAGDSRFSQGRCTTNSECKPSGCSNEVCTSKEDVVSTCELIANHPKNQGLTCQCVQGVCGWQ
jgi:eight-cysteine-cluster-containing protein